MRDGGPLLLPHAGVPWINHEWLSEVTFAAVFNTLGPPGLLGLKALILLVLSGTLVPAPACRGRARAGGWGHRPDGRLHDHHRQPDHPPAVVHLLILPLGAAGHPQGRCRTGHPAGTHLWVRVAGAVVHPADHCPVGELPRRFSLGPRHPGGVGRRARDRDRGGRGAERSPWAKPCGRIALPVLVSLGATLVNPYGYRQMAFLWGALRVPRPDIVEWQPLTIT